MEKGRLFAELIKNLTLLTQLGLELMTPLLLCLGICWYLTAKLGLGGWVFLPGFFFGLGGSGTVALKLYQRTMKQEEKEKKKKPYVGFNRHD